MLFFFPSKFVLTLDLSGFPAISHLFTEGLMLESFLSNIPGTYKGGERNLGQWGIFLLLLICTVPAALVILLSARKITRRVRNLNEILNPNAGMDYSLGSNESRARAAVCWYTAWRDRAPCIFRRRYVHF